MKISRSVLVVFLAGLLLAWPQAWAAAEEPPPAATQAAQSFIQLLDDGKLKQSFALTAPVVREGETEALWHGRMISERESMGDVTSRQFSGAEPVQKFADLPKGDYLMLVFKTDFSTHPGAEERVILADLGNGTFGVVGYKVDYNRWPEAIKMIGNGLFLVFFIMGLLATMTWIVGRLVQGYEKKRAGAKSEQKG